MEFRWPRKNIDRRDGWRSNQSGQHQPRSNADVSPYDWTRLFRDRPYSRSVRVNMSDYVACLQRGSDTKMARPQHWILTQRQNQAAMLGMHMRAFRSILSRSFASTDMDLVIAQLIKRGGGLEVYAADQELFLDAVEEIVNTYQTWPAAPLDPDLPSPESNELISQWVHKFYGHNRDGPPDPENWRTS